MFTGIIDHCGKVIEIKASQKCSTIGIASQFNDLKLGESIAINGTCLTVTEINGENFFADVSPETLRLTNLGNLQINQPVNLERALRMHDRMGGHFVSGHIDQMARLASKKNYQEFVAMRFSGLMPAAQAYLIIKGSIAINGVSLTVNEVFAENGFEIMLIPHTLEITNLGFLKPGDEVNIEYDMLAKMVAKQITNRQERQVGV